MNGRDDFVVTAEWHFGDETAAWRRLWEYIHLKAGVAGVNMSSDDISNEKTAVYQTAAEEEIDEDGVDLSPEA